MIKAHDTCAFKSEDLVVLAGESERLDGKFMTFMKTACKRKKSPP